MFSWDLARHACNHFSLADNWQFSILVVIFMHCKKKRWWFSVYIFDLTCEFVCVFTLRQKRGMLPSLTCFEHTLRLLTLCRTKPVFVCNHGFSFPSSGSPSHGLALYLTFPHTLTYTLTTTGAIRKPTRGQFSHNTSLLFSPSACSVSLCWLLSRHCGTLACQGDIDWEGGEEVQLEMWVMRVCMCECVWESWGGQKEKLNRKAALTVVVP